MIRGRLFWKILIILWVILIITFELIWVAFSLTSEPGKEEKMNYRHATMKVYRVSGIIEKKGIKGLDRLKHKWSKQEQEKFNIVIETPELLEKKNNNSEDIIQNSATAPDGTRYIISYPMAPTSKNKLLHFFNLPLPFLLLGIIGGLLFSFLLAWNISRPMEQLKQAFSKIASGDLSVRLYPKMQLRHDEFKELSIHFDSMVEQLSVLIKAREELLHDVSHELRTPLARLQLAIGLAQQNPNNVNSSLERIELESQRLNKMISEILAFSRSGFSQHRQEQYLDLVTLVQLIIDDANYEAQQSNIYVSLEIEPSVKEESIINGDAELIRRAIENIIRNALRFSTAGQKILSTISRTENILILTIRDFGLGIEENKLKRIFEPFFRILSPNFENTDKGYGLGLAIARKVIISHSGTISAKNADDGQGGLLVTITLPCWH